MQEEMEEESEAEEAYVNKNKGCTAGKAGRSVAEPEFPRDRGGYITRTASSILSAVLLYIVHRIPRSEDSHGLTLLPRVSPWIAFLRKLLYLILGIAGSHCTHMYDCTI